MAPSIHTLHWDLLQAGSAAGDWGREQPVLVTWPAPVNADACFAAAGIEDFGEPDKGWDREWLDIIKRLLSLLARHGPIHVHQFPEVCRPVSTLVRLGRILRGRLGMPRVELTVAQQVELVTTDDRFGGFAATFGANSAARLQAGGGHEVLFVQMPDQSESAIEEFLHRLAGGRPFARTRLDWSKLL